MEEIYDKGGKIPTFDGDAKYFASWWKKFLAYATMNKFKDILKETRDPNLPRKEVSNEDYDLLTKEQRQAIKKNEIAMASFSMAFITDKAMNIVFLASTEGWEEGEAHLVVKELMKRYRPIDTVSRVEMRQQLAKIQFKKGMDPALIFEQLTSIQNQYLGPGKRLDKDELIALILDIATDEYKATLTVERKMKGEKLTVEDLELAMTEEYRQNSRNKMNTFTSKGEMLLMNQGVCYNCGKPGHRANECKSQKLNKSKNFKVNAEPVV
jgi:predicted Zn-ribbon and HTH transcriptional regulator